VSYRSLNLADSRNFPRCDYSPDISSYHIRLISKLISQEFTYLVIQLPRYSTGKDNAIHFENIYNDNDSLIFNHIEEIKAS
jgi:hypothetical protein